MSPLSSHFSWRWRTIFDRCRKPINEKCCSALRKLAEFFIFLRTKLGYKVYILIFILIYTTIYSIVEITIYHSFRFYTWDLGICNQALWNTLHGRLLYYTVHPFYTKTGCFLAAHFSPILLLLLPFYAFFPWPETLLVINILLVAIGALPVYQIANFLLKNEKGAVMLGILYLLFLPLQGATISGFSPESFIGTLFLFIVYYLMKSDFKKLALVFVLGLMTHEASVPVIAFIGIYGMLYHKSAKNKGFQASLIILAICVPYFFFAQHMKIFFGWTGQPSLWHEWTLVGAASTTDLPFKVLLNPTGAWNALAFDGATKLLYITLLLLPVLFLPLLSLRELIPAVPFLFISLFSSYPLYYSLDGHYTVFVVPFVFVGLISGIVRLRGKHRLNISVPKLMTLALLVNAILLIFFLPYTYSKFEVFKINDEHNNVIHSLILHIPQNASILTQSNIFPHLSNRPDAYTIPPPTWGNEYKQVGREILRNLSKTDVKYVLIDFKSEPSYVSAAQLIYADFILVNKGRCELIGGKDGVMLYEIT